MDMDFVLIIFLKRMASGVTEYVGHCTMHARHPTGFTVSGPFQMVHAVYACLFGCGNC